MEEDYEADARDGQALGTLEPQWILDETNNGISFWRRKTQIQDRISVKFLQEVQVIEFEKLEPENEDDWYTHEIIAIALTFLICLAIGLVLPWYLVVGR
ncbi:hypothetical protein WA026_016429 [Henosepilachna vigintioctopunctata]|uniref:Uncharacterized protein n=1 Tax=Henosepilachna vigintioctopunctata TaxID=420089 RepID=A0AAW1UNE3_9CUCU